VLFSLPGNAHLPFISILSYNHKTFLMVLLAKNDIDINFVAMKLKIYACLLWGAKEYNTEITHHLCFQIALISR
jgi:hypothetical protein